MSRNRFVYLNGSFVRESEAAVSVFDRGFMYGDGLFETLRAYRGRLFMFEPHIKRLQRSAKALGIPFRPTLRHLCRAVEQLVALNGFAHRDCAVRITLTRGAAPMSLLPPARCLPTLVVATRGLDKNLPRLQQKGVGVVFLRQAMGNHRLARHKTLHYLPAILARQYARAARAHEAIYLDKAGRVLEGAASNVFAVTGGVVLTPPARGILAGITRGTVIRLARALGLQVRQQPFTSRRLAKADEAFLTASTVEILPVSRVAGAKLPIGGITRRLQEAYRRHVGEAIAG